jgi:hypothetical protein
LYRASGSSPWYARAAELDLASRIAVNYDASIAHVYTNFTKIWTEHANKLEILADCGEFGEHYSRDNTIPSWVVDSQKTIKGQVNNYHDPYQASLNPLMNYHCDEASLLVGGVMFDEIDSFSRVRY